MFRCAAVCRRCRKDNCNVEECKEEKKHTWSAQCPKRIKEVRMNRIRAEKTLSYTKVALEFDNGENVEKLW